MLMKRAVHSQALFWQGEWKKSQFGARIVRVWGIRIMNLDGQVVFRIGLFFRSQRSDVHM